MKKIIRSVILVITISSFILVSCQKELKVNKAIETVVISKKISGDFEMAKQNWNTNAGKLATLKSFSISGRIKADADKEAMINQIMDDNAMAAYGNILDESSMHLQTIGELQKENSSTKETMHSYLEQQLNTGDIIVDVLWQSSLRSFTSKCIVHNDAIVWDNLLTSAFMMDTKPVTTFTGSTEIGKDDLSVSGAQNKTTGVFVAWYKETNSWVGNWIWGSHRGDMGETITIYCTSSGHVYNTDHSDWANMTLGSARSESKILVNTGTYGKIQYALGIATPFASVSFNSSSFKVTVGGLGSSMVRNGSHTLVPWRV